MLQILASVLFNRRTYWGWVRMVTTLLVGLFVTTVRNASGMLTDIHVYLYRINQDDTIKNTEEIA